MDAICIAIHLHCITPRAVSKIYDMSCTRRAAESKVVRGECGFFLFLCALLKASTVLPSLTAVACAGKGCGEARILFLNNVSKGKRKRGSHNRALGRAALMLCDGLGKKSNKNHFL